MKSHIDRLGELGVEVSRNLTIEWVLQSLSESYSEFIKDYCVTDHDMTLNDLTYLLVAAESAMIWSTGFQFKNPSSTSLDLQFLKTRLQWTCSALIAPERSVKFHGSLVAQLLLKDKNLPMNDFVSDWSSTLLTTVSQASKADDISLTRVALSAFLLSLERCPGAQRVVMEKGLHLMRETAKRTMNHKSVQESLAKGLESLCSGEMRLSLEEGQKWSCILLPWVFRETSSDAIRSSAITILSRICEDYGPSSIPISQGWLAIMLSDILKSRKLSLKGSAQPRDKVKTQIDQANVLSGTQSVNQLASVVVNLAVNGDSFALEDFLTLEPFINTYKNLKKGNIPKVNALDCTCNFKGYQSNDSVFTCVIESRWEKDSTSNLRFARLNLVDLAGSESHVIMVLVDGANARTRHVPYRDSRLTFLLQGVVNEDASGDIMVLQQQIQPLKRSLLSLRGTTYPDTTKPTKPCCLMILPFWFSFTCIHSVSQLKSLETSLTGALRRDQMSEASIKQLEAEIEQLNRLVRQREDGNKCTKMMLKFREDKIHDQIQNEAAQDNKENNYVCMVMEALQRYRPQRRSIILDGS
uniref:Kinesin-like protein n=1 Tax=Lactuca sativa TaxID=4236 RepID=A0A9R1VSM2_LACSA|nr:hypothetical protein LSAT_V11C400157590 [Lactuca sativa]